MTDWTYDQFIPTRYDNINELWTNGYPADKAEFLNRLPDEELAAFLETIYHISLSEAFKDLDYKISYFIVKTFNTKKIIWGNNYNISE